MCIELKYVKPGDKKATVEKYGKGYEAYASKKASALVAKGIVVVLKGVGKVRPAKAKR